MVIPTSLIPKPRRQKQVDLILRPVSSRETRATEKLVLHTKTMRLNVTTRTARDGSVLGRLLLFHSLCYFRAFQKKKKRFTLLSALMDTECRLHICKVLNDIFSTKTVLFKLNCQVQNKINKNTILTQN